MTPTESTITTRALVLSAVNTDGRVDADPLFAMATASGHSDKAMRDCLARLVRDGLLVHRGGRGRRASYEATERGLASLDVDLAWAGFAHRVDRGLEPWARTWNLIGFEIPERRRGARDALRNLLVELGAAPVQSGLYAHAYPLIDLLRPVAEQLDVADDVHSIATSSMTIGRARGDAAITARLWNVDALIVRYGDLAERFDTIAASSGDGGDRLVAAMFAAVVEIEAIHRIDPLLPRELLPDDWIGAVARRRYLAAHDTLAGSSSLYAESQLGQAFASEITRATDETSEQFWHRWLPVLVAAYRRQLPPAALP